MTKQDNSKPKQKALAPYRDAIKKAYPRFNRVNKLLNFEQEEVFAVQQLMKTQYAMDCANNNPASLQLAMINVAATGLTLNPAYGYAYLVPRDGGIVLDISYKGLIKIATDTGSIVYAQADVVCENDEFEYRGPYEKPVIGNIDVFHPERRGEVIGAYCVAKTPDGDYLTTALPLDEIEVIRNSSDLYRLKKKGPWVNYFREMCKKAATKRAQKMWPKTQKIERLLDAIELSNNAEGGYTFDAEAHEFINKDQASQIEWALEEISANKELFLSYMGVESFEAIPSSRFNEAMESIHTRRRALESIPSEDTHDNS